MNSIVKLTGKSTDKSTGKSITKVIGVCLMFICFQINAQKVGYVNGAELVNSFPEVKKFNEGIAEESKKFTLSDSLSRNEVIKKLTEVEKKDKDGSITKADSDVTKTKLQKEWEKLDLDKKDKTKELNDKLQLFYKPIYEKINAVIKEVCKIEKYTMLFDSSVTSFLYAEDNANLLTALKAKLNLK